MRLPSIEYLETYFKQGQDIRAIQKIVELDPKTLQTSSHQNSRSTSSDQINGLNVALLLHSIQQKDKDAQHQKGGTVSCIHGAQLKAFIPSNTDTNRHLYNKYLQRRQENLQNNSAAGSCADLGSFTVQGPHMNGARGSAYDHLQTVNDGARGSAYDPLQTINDGARGSAYDPLQTADDRVLDVLRPGYKENDTAKSWGRLDGGLPPYNDDRSNSYNDTDEVLNLLKQAPDELFTGMITPTGRSSPNNGMMESDDGEDSW
jgi:hypothetical protein